MTYAAPPRVHRWAFRALLLTVVALCALGAVGAAGLAVAAPAVARDGAVDPSMTTSTTPGPEPTSTETATPGPTPTPTPAHAEVSLVRSACDTLQLSATTDAGRTLAYRITDEAGRTAASGTFTGSLDAALPVTTGHTYIAHVSEAAEGEALASSASADLREACPVAITADAPHFDDRCGTEHDAVLVPRIIGVDYRAGVTELVPGSNAAHGRVTIDATARPGYTLSGPSRWVGTFSAEPCVSPTPPPAAEATPAPIVPEPEAGAVPPTTASPAPTAAAPSSTLPSVVPTAETTRTAAEPSSQAGVGAPGPLAWGIMISLAVAGGVFFWSKTRH